VLPKERMFEISEHQSPFEYRPPIC